MKLTVKETMDVPKRLRDWFEDSDSEILAEKRAAHNKLAVRKMAAYHSEVKATLGLGLRLRRWLPTTVK